MFPSCRATTTAFLDDFSGCEKAICSAINHSGSAIVPAKPAILFSISTRGKVSVQGVLAGTRAQRR